MSRKYPEPKEPEVIELGHCRYNGRDMGDRHNGYLLFPYGRKIITLQDLQKRSAYDVCSPFCEPAKEILG